MAYYVPPLSKKVGGHVPRILHQIAPMLETVLQECLTSLFFLPPMFFGPLIILKLRLVCTKKKKKKK